MAKKDEISSIEEVKSERLTVSQFCNKKQLNGLIRDFITERFSLETLTEQEWETKLKNKGIIF